MSSVGLQPELTPVLQQEKSPITNAHRWIDLGLVLAIAFGSAILSSTYLAFNPASPQFSNMRLAAGMLQESIGLLLFFVLFKRQGRNLRNVGLEFNWKDLPRGLGLVFAAFILMWAVYLGISYTYYFTVFHAPHWAETSKMFTAASLWALLPFLLLNPFFEEILVRGYLMTELIDLRKSAFLAAVVSIVFQTSYHLYYGFWGAVVVGCGFIPFAIYYAKTKRLMPVIFAHMLWDLTALWGNWHR